MPASGALGSFLSAMMELRSQRLKEQQIEEEMKQQGMQDLGQGISSGISSLGKGLTAGMQSQRTDALANKLGADIPGWTGGGAQEIDLRKAMGQFSQRGGDDYYKQASFQLRQAAEDRASRGEQIASQQRSYQADRNMSQDAKQDINDALGFEEKMKSSLAKISDPTKQLSPAEYSAEAGNIRSIRAAAEKRKLPMPEFTIPPYMSSQEQDALKTYNQARQDSSVKGQEYREAVQGVQSVPGSGIGPGPVYAPGPGESLPALQGAPQQQPSTAAPSAGTGGNRPIRGTAKGPGGAIPAVSYDGGKTWYPE